MSRPGSAGTDQGGAAWLLRSGLNKDLGDEDRAEHESPEALAQRVVEQLLA